MLLRIAIAAVCFAVSGCGGDAPKPLRVAVFGDSIPFGYDLPVGLVQRMEQMRPGWYIQKRYAGSLRLQQLIDGDYAFTEQDE